MGKAYLIISGKGGVGKTTFATSAAQLLARRGFSVALIDADVGLRCADQLLNLQDQVVYDLGDVLEKRCTVQTACVRGRGDERLQLLAAPQMLSPSDVDKRDMARLIRLLKRQNDFVLIDCPSGIGRGIKNVWSEADEALLVATPDDACIRDAERVSSLLFERLRLRAQLVLNRVDRGMIFEGGMKKPARIAEALDLRLLAAIPFDREVYRALLRHKPASEADSRRVRRALNTAVDRMLGLDKKLPRYCR